MGDGEGRRETAGVPGPDLLAWYRLPSGRRVFFQRGQTREPAHAGRAATTPTLRRQTLHADLSWTQEVEPGNRRQRLAQHLDGAVGIGRADGQRDFLHGRPDDAATARAGPHEPVHREAQRAVGAAQRSRSEPPEVVGAIQVGGRGLIGRVQSPAIGVVPIPEVPRRPPADLAVVLRQLGARPVELQRGPDPDLDLAIPRPPAYVRVVPEAAAGAQVGRPVDALQLPRGLHDLIVSVPGREHAAVGGELAVGGRPAPQRARGLMPLDAGRSLAEGLRGAEKLEAVIHARVIPGASAHSRGAIPSARSRRR